MYPSENEHQKRKKKNLKYAAILFRQLTIGFFISHGNCWRARALTFSHLILLLCVERKEEGKKNARRSYLIFWVLYDCMVMMTLWFDLVFEVDKQSTNKRAVQYYVFMEHFFFSVVSQITFAPLHLVISFANICTRPSQAHTGKKNTKTKMHQPATMAKWWSQNVCAGLLDRHCTYRRGDIRISHFGIYTKYIHTNSFKWTFSTATTTKTVRTNVDTDEIHSVQRTFVCISKSYFAPCP